MPDTTISARALRQLAEARYLRQHQFIGMLGYDPQPQLDVEGTGATQILPNSQAPIKPISTAPRMYDQTLTPPGVLAEWKRAILAGQAGGLQGAQ